MKTIMEKGGKTPEEIRETLKLQIESYGIEIPTFEERLDTAIANTEQRLDILEYIKDLIANNPDLTKEEIRDLVVEEFGLELPEFNENGMGFRHDFRERRFGGFRSGFSFNDKNPKI